MPVILKPRHKLCQFLKKQIDSVTRDSYLKNVLQQAIEGLVALGYGESQLIFSPDGKNGSHDGTKPYTLRKLRMQAIGFADLLIANNYKGKRPPIHTVANAYGENVDAFIAWRKSKRLGKTNDPLMKSFREAIGKLPFDEAAVLSRLQEAGAFYKKQKKLAHKSKKS
jgi:hypothetical protein